MSTAVHVNGPAIIYTGSPLFDATHLLAAGYTQGSSSLGSPAQLGISVDGVEITLSTYDDPIIADTGGMRLPVDLQDMGIDALIRFQLVIYDLTVLQPLRQRSGATEGTLPQLGALVAANLYTKRLIISGAADDGPWRFYNTYPRNVESTKVGTKRTIWNLELYAWAVIGNAVTAASGAPPAGSIPLYDHVNG
jgi:hypothetical protein